MNEQEYKIILALKWGMAQVKALDPKTIPTWGWVVGGGSGLYVVGGCPNMDLTEDEIQEQATPDCGPKLWLLRAWAVKRGLSRQQADQFFYFYCSEAGDSEIGLLSDK